MITTELSSRPKHDGFICSVSGHSLHIVIRTSFTPREVWRMSWRGRSVGDQRVEFVIRASRGECLSELCREYEITRPTGYLWLHRFQQEGVRGIEERSRRPHASPHQTAATVEQRIEQLRRE